MPDKFPWAKSNVFLFDPSRFALYTEPPKSVKKHAAAFQIQKQSDPFHQMVENNFRSFLRFPSATSMGARLTVLPRGGSPRSVQYIIRLARSRSRSMGSGRFSIEQFDVVAVRRRLPLRNFQIGAEDAPLAGIVRAFLRPVELSGLEDRERCPRTISSHRARDGGRPGSCQRGFRSWNHRDCTA